MSIIALRIYQIKRVERNSPETQCTEVLTQEEWKILYCFVHKTKDLPQQPPTAKDVMLWIAKLGGFPGRKAKQNEKWPKGSKKIRAR